MTQKEAVLRLLGFAEQHFVGEGNTMIAARAILAVLWLQHINWHSEARALCRKIRATPRLKNAFVKLERDVTLIDGFRDAVILFTWIFGCGLNTDEWQATRGAPLVDELWGIINTLFVFHGDSMSTRNVL